jgi:hypothetical protein
VWGKAFEVDLKGIRVMMKAGTSFDEEELP